MAKRKKITKDEKRFLQVTLLSVLSFAFFSQPLQDLLGSSFSNNLPRVLVGILLIGGLLYWWNVK